MSKKIVTAIFQNSQNADTAIYSLKDIGYSKNNLSVFTKESSHISNYTNVYYGATTNNDIVSGTAGGTSASGIPGVLIGFGASADTNTVSSDTGPLAPLLGYSLPQSISQKLMDLGIDKSYSKEYEKDVRKNKVLLYIEANNSELTQTTDILQKSGAEKVNIH